MKPSLPLLTTAFVGALIACRIHAPAHADDDLETLEEQQIQAAAASADPSIVRIETAGGVEQVDGLLLGSGPTTGVVISSDGYILTSSFNFAGKPSTVIVSIPGRDRLPARIVATDRLRGLTLLRVEASDLKPIEAAPAGSCKVGQTALALGRTYDPEFPSVSVGVVSALHRIWGKAIQTDAKTSPVNYGGPLVNLRGQAIGVITALAPEESTVAATVEWYDSGIGFAIPVHDALASADRLKSGADIHPGLLGVTFQKGSPLDNVPVVDRVRFGSPAEQAGLKSGDKIVAAEGRAVRRVPQLKQILGAMAAGDAVRLTFERAGANTDVTATLVESLPPYNPPWLGLIAERGPPSPEGVVVRYVFPGSPADQAQLKPGDRIRRVAETAVDHRDALDAVVCRRKPGDSLAIVGSRDGRPIEEAVQLAERPPSLPADIPAASSAVPPADWKLGRRQETFPGHDLEYWIYAPATIGQTRPPALVVFLHPPGDSLEKDLLAAWKPLCDERGVVLLAPLAEKRARWTPGDVESVKNLAAAVRDQYLVDSRRIFVHAAADSAPFALLTTFRHRDVFRGALLFDSAGPRQPPEHDPDSRQSFYFRWSRPQLRTDAATQSLKPLQSQNYPVIVERPATSDDPSANAGYPSSDALSGIGRWIESLDAI